MTLYKEEHDTDPSGCPKLRPNASIWKRLQVWFRLMSVLSPSHPQTCYFYRSKAAIRDERRRHITSTDNWYIIHPLSRFHMCWRMFMTIVWMLIMHNDIFDAFFYRTFELAKRTPQGFTKWLATANAICTIDIGLNFITGYTQCCPHQTVLEQKKIAWKYLRSHFLFDMASVVQCYMMFINTPACKWYNTSLWAAFKVLRLVRLATVLHNVDLFTEILHLSDIFRSVIKYIIVHIYLVHFFGGLMAYVPYLSGVYLCSDSTYDILEDSWIRRRKELMYPDDDDLPAEALYYHSIMETSYMMFKPLTALQRVRIEDILVLNLITLVGAIYRICVFITVLNYVSSVYYSSCSFDSFACQLRAYGTDTCRENLVLRDRLLQYFDQYFGGMYFHEAEILNRLEPHNRFEVFVECSENLIKNCALFRDLPPIALVALASRLKFEVYPPGVQIISVGDPSPNMYFLASGTVAVIRENGKELCHLTDGDYFGEVGLLSVFLKRVNKRTANVFAIDHCFVYRLDQKSFCDVTKSSGEIYNRISSTANKRISFDETNES